tara:strand:+ start:276 stop:1433 length:1158 start_codon:yes stop_codon:yes gene_type:complete
MVYKTLKTKGIPFKFKDGIGQSYAGTENVVPNNVVEDKDANGKEISYVRQGKGETYIPVKDNHKIAMNKIQHTKVGDDIHYYQNGVEGRGIVVKMSNEYVMVAKEDGDFQDIHINDTFFVKDIVVNKTWDMMNTSERGEVLVKAHAPSTRFVTKNWYELPRELQEVLTKQTGSTQEAGVSRGAETRTYRDQDKSLAANNPATDDDQAEGLKNASDVGKVYEGADVNNAEVPDTSNMRIGKKKKPKGKKCVSCGKIHGDKKASDVEHGTYGTAGGSGGQAGVSTQAAFDIDEDTGYEERPHICEDCVGKLPRSDAKDHHADETKEDKKEHSLKEQFDKVKEKEKSEQFRKIYGGGKKKKKGVPEWNVNTWGINYTVKEDGEEEETV